MNATWKLIKTNVRLSCHLPTRATFIANIYECTNCHNIANDRNGLPEVCPWCKAEMTDVVIDKEEATKIMPSLGIVFDAMNSSTKGEAQHDTTFYNTKSNQRRIGRGERERDPFDTARVRCGRVDSDHEPGEILYNRFVRECHGDHPSCIRRAV